MRFLIFHTGFSSDDICRVMYVLNVISSVQGAPVNL